MARNLDVALLRSFLYVVESGSMAEAAARLHQSQGAVNQQIKRLELLLGVELLVRDIGQAQPTAAGQRLLDKAAQLVALNDELLAEMRAPEVRGALRLGVPFDLVGSHMAPVLEAYGRAYPQVAVSLVTAASSELLKAMVRGQLDLMLLEEALPRCQGERLMVDRLAWVGARGGAAAAKRPLPVCLVSETCAFRPDIFAALDRAGIHWRLVFDNASLDAAKVAVRADLAVTVWLSSTVPDDLERLQGGAALPELPEMAICLQLAKGKPGPAALAMADAIRAAYRARQRNA
ncbi:LysR substrate-binding domain-containing protein [Massilia sp. TS11]|uniref:LysR substrate-binding domain-containing protein n=1 Tax=Massilia sp. TS11 TaxID=2908003 RepID=UPI001EDBCBC3|nr:LysR substrate-binding domain-containing protein [Massilia sp. TS11]MCG2583346.1 LysR substrate-binding domain-containing protein [Massilia sp. TS11]